MMLVDRIFLVDIDFEEFIVYGVFEVFESNLVASLSVVLTGS